ncbi:hypothetical protein ACW9PK_12330 [Kocuria sp. MNB10]
MSKAGQQTEAVDNGHRMGATTKGAAAGTGVGGAIGILAAYVLIKTGVEDDPATAATIGSAVAVLIAAVGTLIGGKFTPTDAKPVQINIPEVAGRGVLGFPGMPDGTGEHRALAQPADTDPPRANAPEEDLDLIDEGTALAVENSERFGDPIVELEVELAQLDRNPAGGSTAA